MTNATFHNFTDQPFTGYWNGKPKTFKAGERLYMPSWLAEHFAKHLTNQELIKSGKEVYTSPKNPGQVPEFMNLFRKAFIADGKKASGSEIDEAIASAQVPSMNVNVEKPKIIEQGPAAALAAEENRTETKELEIEGSGGSDAPLVITPPDADDDESGFDHGNA